MNYIPIVNYLEKLKMSVANQDDRDEIRAIEILLQTVESKLAAIGDHSVDLYIPTSQIMGVIQDEETLLLANSEITRILIVYDFITNTLKQPTITDITTYKVNNPTRDDVANEKRIVERLEQKNLVSIDRVVDSDPNYTVRLTEEGTKFIEYYILDVDALIELFNRSRSSKIKDFITAYIDKAKKLHQI